MEEHYILHNFLLPYTVHLFHPAAYTLTRKGGVTFGNTVSHIPPIKSSLLYYFKRCRVLVESFDINEQSLWLNLYEYCFSFKQQIRALTGTGAQWNPKARLRQRSGSGKVRTVRSVSRRTKPEVQAGNP